MLNDVNGYIAWQSKERKRELKLIWVLWSRKQGRLIPKCKEINSHSELEYIQYKIEKKVEFLYTNVHIDSYSTQDEIESKRCAQYDFFFQHPIFPHGDIFQIKRIAQVGIDLSQRCEGKKTVATLAPRLYISIYKVKEPTTVCPASSTFNLSICMYLYTYCMDRDRIVWFDSSCVCSALGNGRLPLPESAADVLWPGTRWKIGDKRRAHFFSYVNAKSRFYSARIVNQQRQCIGVMLHRGIEKIRSNTDRVGLNVLWYIYIYSR